MRQLTDNIAQDEVQKKTFDIISEKNNTQWVINCC